MSFVLIDVFMHTFWNSFSYNGIGILGYKQLAAVSGEAGCCEFLVYKNALICIPTKFSNYYLKLNVSQMRFKESLKNETNCETMTKIINLRFSECAMKVHKGLLAGPN